MKCSDHNTLSYSVYFIELSTTQTSAQHDSLYVNIQNHVDSWIETGTTAFTSLLKISPIVPSMLSALGIFEDGARLSTNSYFVDLLFPFI